LARTPAAHRSERHDDGSFGRRFPPNDFNEKAFVAPSKSGDRAGESSSDVVRLPHGALHLDMCIVYYTRSPLDGNPREAREDAASRANVFRAGGIAASGYGNETLFVAALRLKNCRRHE
jgi:hypothetical protein